MDACSACFSPELRDLFTPDSLAVALQQLVELVRLPVLFMRTVIQTATVAPKLHSCILDLLSKEALAQAPDLVAPLSAYAATPAVRSTVPGAIRDLLAEVGEAAPEAP